MSASHLLGFLLRKVTLGRIIRTYAELCASGSVNRPHSVHQILPECNLMEEFRSEQIFRTTQYLKQAAVSDITNTDKTTRDANRVENRNDDCINSRNKACIS